MLYMCVDLKCFYASVELKKRNLDPFTTPLIVCDKDRGSNAIVLAISPYLKSLGYKSRCRYSDIKDVKNLIIAKPHMTDYIKESNEVYNVLLDFVSSEDIFAYSIDESFLDLTQYINYYELSPMELAKKINDKIFEKTNLYTTVGIGTNIYLAKVALDIMAKKSPNFIGYLDQDIFIKNLWNHTPLSDFFQIGLKTEAKLNYLGLYTLNDIAKSDVKMLLKEFGVLGQDIYNHAWGIDDTTMYDVKSYKPKAKNISKSQVLFRDYSKEEAKTILVEMVNMLEMEIIKRNVKCQGIFLFVGYSAKTGGGYSKNIKLENHTSSYQKLLKEFKELYNNVLDNPIRIIGVGAFNIISDKFTQLSLFDCDDEKDYLLHKTILTIKNRFGKNAINKATSYFSESTGVLRNKLIGGHNA